MVDQVKIQAALLQPLLVQKTMPSPLKRQQQSLNRVRQVERVLLVIRVLVEARFFMLRLLVLLLRVLLAALHVCIWKLRLLGGLWLLRLTAEG